MGLAVMIGVMAALVATVVTVWVGAGVVVVRLGRVVAAAGTVTTAGPATRERDGERKATDTTEWVLQLGRLWGGNAALLPGCLVGRGVEGAGGEGLQLQKWFAKGGRPLCCIVVHLRQALHASVK